MSSNQSLSIFRYYLFKSLTLKNLANPLYQNDVGLVWSNLFDTDHLAQHLSSDSDSNVAKSLLAFFGYQELFLNLNHF